MASFVSAFAKRLVSYSESVLILSIGLVANTSRGEDWPMWRGDSMRSASSSESLSKALRIEHTIVGTARNQAWEDPLNMDVMAYDRVFEPIIVGGQLIVGYSDSNKVVSYDMKSGDKVWSFFAEGPVRLPLAAADGAVYFSSDDGGLYCLDSKSGTLRWRF